MALSTSFEFSQVQDFDCWITGPLVSMRSCLGLDFFDNYYKSEKQEVFGIGKPGTKIRLLPDKPPVDSFEAVSRAVRSILSNQTCKQHSIFRNALTDDEDGVQFQQQTLPCISPGCPKTIFDLFGADVSQKETISKATSLVLCNRPTDWKRIFYTNISLEDTIKILRNKDIIKVLVLNFDRHHAVAFLDYSSKYDLIYYIDPSHGEGKRCRSDDLYMMCIVPKHLFV